MDYREKEREMEIKERTESDILNALLFLQSGEKDAAQLILENWKTWQEAGYPMNFQNKNSSISFTAEI